MTRAVLALALALALSGCAAVDRAQIADGATTIYALAEGFDEANPVFSGLSGPEIFAVKLALTQGAKLLPEPVCTPTLVSLTIAGYSAAAWNVFAIVGTAAASLPFSIAAALYFSPFIRSDAQATCADPW